MEMNVIGIGVMLQTEAGTYLLQERDHKARLNPGRIAPFGGGIWENENTFDCAKRELLEELVLDIEIEKLQDIGLFRSRNESGTYIQMFLARNIDKSALKLQEGKRIVELGLDEALENTLVTDFTKEVLKTL